MGGWVGRWGSRYTDEGLMDGEVDRCVGRWVDG